MKYKIDNLENNIKILFKKRAGLIPSIFEVTKPYFNKHNEIFREILALRKNEFIYNEFSQNFDIAILTESKILHELNFIFNICNKHKKMNKNSKFLYLRDIVIERSFYIGKQIDLYESILKKYNHLINIKNITIVGLLIPLTKKDEI